MIEMIRPYYNTGNAEAACELLVKEAVNRWSKENIIDDITVIVVFLNKGLESYAERSNFKK